MLSQSVRVKSIASVAEYNKPAVKAVYETSYGISLDIYDTNAAKFKVGCSVQSDATLARRAGVKVTFTATIAPAQATQAKSKSDALYANPGTLATNVAAAKIAVKKEGKVAAADVDAVVAPQASDLVVEKAVDKTPASDTVKASSSSSSPLLLIIIIVVAVVVIAVVAVIVVYCCACKSDPVATKENGKSGKMTEVPMPGLGVQDGQPVASK